MDKDVVVDRSQCRDPHEVALDVGKAFDWPSRAVAQPSDVTQNIELDINIEEMISRLLLH